ncbi:iron complex outermembrane recepter protein [Thermotomaculum hydrothermale]|uniref:Iron complex outermembrane recepter protein n=1 Tax=Thermotomaculum hydrothermale TaxID=981385 RepID=A0A7R6SYM8_9BACT|nr:TonB-dependent receptor plug domain-containing protein [Thermotomaculum hydrothermale]BBB31892.1 iron complex outermembrane recepter protein [Thermotomaculum hydrothermale]
MKVKFLLFAFLLSFSLFASENLQVKESIEVTAEKGNENAVQYIDKSLIDALSINSNDEILSLFPSVFLSVRGLNGVQADISFRGSRGNQVGVSILGVPLNNMQTYHHNFDIPLAPEDVKSVEVEPSTNANLTPYSFSGNIDFEPGENQKEFNHLAYGSDDYYHIYARENGLSYMFEGSSGYIENSKYNKSNVTYQFKYKGVKFFTAFNSKHFDAKDFYAPYPSYERTQTSLFIASLGKTKFYTTRHYDIFTLDKNNPDLFRNITETYKSGFKTGLENRFGFWGLNIEFNSMDSKTMGDHNLTTSILKYAKVFNFFGFNFRGGANYFSATNRGKYLLPFLSVVKPLGKFNFSFDFSESVRVPDFTELYYNSPVNHGNENLKEEKSENYQVSLGFKNIKTVFFYRNEKNLIDWVRSGEEWQAENTGDSDVYGFDFFYTFKKLTIGYEHLHKTNTEYETKYNYYYPKNKLTLIYKGKDISLDYSYLDINNLDKASVLNITFWGEGFYLKILNAFDEDYQTYPGIPMPGRVVIFGYRMRGPLIPD